MDRLSRNIPVGIVEQHEIAGVPVDIRTQHLQNTNLKGYHQTNIFGEICSRKIKTS
jgi:hypothetical protein